MCAENFRIRTVLGRVRSRSGSEKQVAESWESGGSVWCTKMVRSRAVLGRVDHEVQKTGSLRSVEMVELKMVEMRAVSGGVRSGLGVKGCLDGLGKAVEIDYWCRGGAIRTSLGKGGSVSLEKRVQTSLEKRWRSCGGEILEIGAGSGDGVGSVAVSKRWEQSENYQTVFEHGIGCGARDF
ncbi:hypothetical protein AAG906_020750 [Vitis piasezkii]